MQLRFYLTGYKLVMQSTEKMLENLLNFDIIGKGVIDIAKNVYDMVMSGKSDNNIRFADLQNLLYGLNFSYRVKGDHFIYYREDISEIINIQPRGNKAKGYEVKQIRLLFKKYAI